MAIWLPKSETYGEKSFIKEAPGLPRIGHHSINANEQLAQVCTSRKQHIGKTDRNGDISSPILVEGFLTSE